MSRTASSCPGVTSQSLPATFLGVVLRVTRVHPLGSGSLPRRFLWQGAGQVAVCCEINPVTAIDWRWETALPLAGKVSHCLSRFCQMAVKPETCKGCGTATGHLGRQGTCSSWLLLGQRSSLWLVRHQTAPGRVLFDGRTCRNSVPCGCFPVAPRARGGLSSPSVVG